MKIIVYSSSSTFGGHELMSLAGLEALLADGHELEIWLFEKNSLFLRGLRSLQLAFSKSLTIRLNTYQMRSVQIVRTWLGIGYIWGLSRSFRKSGADRLLVLQGDIEQSSEAVIAGKVAGLKTISYIPMIMEGSARGIRFARLRDALSLPLYRLADRFIVISKYFDSRLRRLGVNDSVVVFNSIDDEFFVAPSARDRVRTELGVAPNEMISGFLGRLSYQQKGLDRLLEILKADRGFFSANRMLVVGDGPDRERFRVELEQSGLTDCVILCPWSTSARYAYFDTMDVFLCTSRFEGVPLSLIEAIVRRVTVVSVALKPLLGILPVYFVGGVDDAFDAKAFVAAVKLVSVPRDENLTTIPTEFFSLVQSIRFKSDFLAAVIR